MNRYFTRLLPALLLCGALSSSAAQAGSVTPEQKGEIEEIIRGYLLEHPEILREMSEKLENKEKLAEDAVRGKALLENVAAVFKMEADPVLGNPKGDVTIVEFMDYNCGWCKRSIGEISQLLEKDKNLRIVIKEFPIFGANSEYAARAALAAAKQGKYWDIHQMLFSQEGQITPEVVDQVATELGLDMTKLKADMADKSVLGAISANYDLAKSLQLNGTPAFVIDKTVVPGYMPLDGLEAAVADVRKNGGCQIC